MSTTPHDVILSINRLVQSDDWVNLMLLRYSPYRLIVAVGEQLEYYHKLEIIFDDVDFVSLPVL